MMRLILASFIISMAAFTAEAGSVDSVAVAVDTLAVASDTVSVGGAAAVPDSIAAVSPAPDTVAVDSAVVAVAGSVAVDSAAVSAAVVAAPDTVAVDSVAAAVPDAVADTVSVASCEAEALPSGPYLLVNDLQSPMVNFNGEGGLQTVSVKSSTGEWYLEDTIPWCEVKNVTDSSFTIRCRVNSAPLARHSYIKVMAQGVENASVAVVQVSLQENFLSTGAWRDSLKNCRIFECGEKFLLISENELGFEDCPYALFYIGEMAGGHKTGQGCCYDRYGNLIYSGTFYKDIPAGDFPSRDDYSNYKFECQKFSNGTIYFGETCKGLRHGYGIFISADGTVWFGRWNSGQQVMSEGSVVTLTSEVSDFEL